MGTIINVKQGQMTGVDMGDYSLFKGVPYAKAPVGDLRWKAPQEPDSWEGVFVADTFAACCPQRLPIPDHPIMGRFCKEFYSNPDFMVPMSEDCLYLNIWAPNHALNSDSKLPVAFYIHGGGFSGGFGSELEFDGEAYCKKDVILVTIEYRTNAFGFLAHPWLDAENEQGISGNYGILDQIQALKWVSENIAQFGGDPSNITVFGQSAGCMSTQVLVSSDLSKDMVAKAIFQSGMTCESDILLTPTLKEEEEFGQVFVDCAGVTSVEELRALTTDQILAAGDAFGAQMWQTGKGLTQVPCVDGYVLKETVRDTWSHGTMANVPSMAGVVIDDLGAKRKEVKAKQTGELMEECKRWSFKREEVAGDPSYLYFFAHELPGDDWGAFHSCELWYMFGSLGRCWRPMTEHDYALSEEMVSNWTNFMKTGKPDADGSWKPCGKENPYIKKYE